MKKEIIDIPEVSLSDVKEFWVLGSQYKDGILGEYNLKMDVKAAIEGGGGSEEQDIIWIDVSGYAYPADPEEVLSIPEIAFPELGTSVKVKEPDGRVHIYDVYKNTWDETIVGRECTAEDAGKGIFGNYLEFNGEGTGHINWYSWVKD